PKMNDGIMVLDESLGKLECGKPLSELSGIEDDVIEIGLTPNRGDCLSIRGIARDLSVVYKKPLNERPSLAEEENLLGIGRIIVLHVEEKIQSNFVYKAFEQGSIGPNVLMELRLALVESSYVGPIERLMVYTTYSTGVLLRAYDYNCFDKDGEKAIVYLKKDETGLDSVYAKDGRIAYVGHSQELSCRATLDTKTIIVEASFTPPETISNLSAQNKNLTSDRYLYRSSRGSEPDLEIGMSYLWQLLGEEKGIKLYAGGQKVGHDIPLRVVVVHMEELSGMIGQEVPKNKVVDILKRLGFDIHMKGEQDILNITVPLFRHDVFGAQDVCEEVVRIIGIDNITSKPLVFAEKSRANKTLERHRLRNNLRKRAAAVGFFESVHYLFDSREKQEFYGLRTLYKKRELSNPITTDLNTMRATLLLHLLEAASNNIKNGRKSVSLFELGRIFDSSRNESVKLGFVFSGEKEQPCVQNHGKPEYIDFMTFATKIEHAIGPMRLESSIPTDKLANPHEYAAVFVRENLVGYIARVHASVESEMDLPRTYIAMIDVEGLIKGRVLVKPYSRYPSSSRDLSLVVPKDMAYHTLRHSIESANIPELSRFYPIDRFESDSLGEYVSLTISFWFQNEKRTLEEKEVQDAMDLLQKHLQNSLGVTIR
ncbi:MAG: phenylalanine--tRNA ligase subunit beta, partial [Campylobacteraceae bacterium]|nr:phenylalanine--tRNA ligase subunit beta [Campylobacteraceae bacterium]